MKKIQQRIILITSLFVTLSAQTVIAQWVSKAAVPVTGRWGAMSFALNNKVYVGGGYIGNFVNLNDFHEYNPANNTWTAKGTIPGTPTMRTAGVAFVINGKAYVGLGATDYNNFSPMPAYLSDLWEYDGNTWTQKASLQGGGRADAAVFVVNNKAYVVGGTTTAGSNGETDEVWEYDPAGNKWTAKAAIATGDINNASGFAINGKGYIMGGQLASGYNNKVYEYDPAANTWTAKAALPATANARGGGVAFVIGGKAYYGMGEESAGTAATFYKDFFAYDPNPNMWTNMVGMTGGGRAYGIAVTINNKGYVGGGWSRSGSAQTFYTDFFEVDPSTLSVTGLRSGVSISTYPNPAKDMLYISSGVKSENIMYAVYSLTGQKLLSGQLDTDMGINVNRLTAGNYILEISSVKESGRTLVTIQN